METKKQLHEDLGKLWRYLLSHTPVTVHLCIDQRDLQIREHVHKIETLEETCVDFEHTINQFRELVMQLQRCSFLYPGRLIMLNALLSSQSDLDSLRAQTYSAV